MSLTTGVEQGGNGAPDGVTANIGPNIAYHRRLRGMKASELARATGVSPSLISQIERGHANPSIGTLVSIAGALDVPLDAFISAAPPGHAEAQPAASERRGEHAAAASPAQVGGTGGGKRHVVRKGERTAIEVAGGLRWFRLTPAAFSEDVYFAEFVFSPGAESNQVMYTHPGAEMLVVTEGELTVYVAFERYVLTAGDSIAFESTLPHRYVNERETEARAFTSVLSGRVVVAGHPGAGPVQDPGMVSIP